jgi:hypothetical protein
MGKHVEGAAGITASRDLGKRRQSAKHGIARQI